MTVYAVAYNEESANDNLTCPVDGELQPSEEDETLTWFELDGINPEPNEWNDINFGFIDKVADSRHCPTNIFSKFRYDGFGGMPIDAAGLPIAGARLSLVGTFEAGAGCKDFTFGTQAVVPPDTAPDYRYSHTGYETYDTLRERPGISDELWAGRVRPVHRCHAFRGDRRLELDPLQSVAALRPNQNTHPEWISTNAP